jgi:hypothetical protein
MAAALPSQAAYTRFTVRHTLHQQHLLIIGTGKKSAEERKTPPGALPIRPPLRSCGSLAMLLVMYRASSMVST